MQTDWLVLQGRVHMFLSVCRETKFPGCYNEHFQNRLWITGQTLPGSCYQIFDYVQEFCLLLKS